MKHIAIVGMGTMGSAIESRLQEGYEVTGIGRDGSLAQVEGADAVIIAVKPQQFGELANDLWLHIQEEQLVLSVMAGITTERIGRMLGTQHVVRTMPNLGLTTGKSLTAWYTKDQDIDVAAVEGLLSTWGTDMRLHDENQFHNFTPLAGSSPAFLFEMARILEAEAARRGFTAKQARQIATHTFLGAASLVTPETNFGDLVTKVASKGGTTESALKVFKQKDLAGTVRQALDAANRRSQELGD